MRRAGLCLPVALGVPQCQQPDDAADPVHPRLHPAYAPCQQRQPQPRLQQLFREFLEQRLGRMQLIDVGTRRLGPARREDAHS